jgi:NAD(P)-dependent dehydrogenase (short-subunit alcohol dehydrogenase family)
LGAGVDLGLSGRTAIVCGASAGMGLAIAEALASEGANVAMFARRRDVLAREADRIGGLAVRGDVTNPADLKRLVDRTIQAFGGIDILVNNSGGPPRTTAAELDDAQVEALRERVSEAVGQEAKVVATVDPEIIGGLVLKARGVLLDASIRRRLQDIRQALIRTPLPVGSEA